MKNHDSLKIQTIICQGIKVDLDEEGWLINPEQWNEHIARIIAKKEGIKELTPDMLAIIHFIRNYYINNDVFPNLRLVCKTLYKSTDCVLTFFGHHARAWKIAGLPQPTGELDYLLGGF